MSRKELIENTISKIQKLPNDKIEELNNFAEFLLSRLDDKILNEGIKSLVANSKTFEYLKDEENLYTVNDLKEKYK